MPQTVSGEARIHWTDEGAGPAIVLLHGAGSCGAVWFGQVPALAARHRVLTMDHRGFGRSPCPDAAVDSRAFAGDLAAVLDAAGIGRTVLVGQSMGGWTALAFALAHPDRVRGLVLSASPGGLMLPEVRRRFELAVARARTEPAAALVLSEGFRAARPDLAWLYGQLGSFATPPGVLGQLADPARAVDPVLLAGWTVPTLILAGALDPIFPPEGLQAVRAAIPGAALQVLPGCGHSPGIEDPAGFNARLLAFLDRLPD